MIEVLLLILPPFTLGNVVAGLISLTGAFFIVFAMSRGFIEDILIGGILLVIGWWITTIGAVL